MTVLFHACCGPCLGGSYPTISQKGLELVAFWENPNIHPYMEYTLRDRSFLALTDSLKIPVERGDDAYGLNRFLARLQGAHGPGRCRVCYEMRLEAAAVRAKTLGLEAFSTTLLISPYQQHDVLREVGEQIGMKLGVPFLYLDLRPVFRKTHEAAREHELYKQKYCGCIFSEEDRFANDPKYCLKTMIDSAKSGSL